ncbi:hypothetical protein KI387_031993, partial [Taxus chinensis]
MFSEERGLLKTIVNDVSRVVKDVPLIVAKHPVGLEKTVEDFEKTMLQPAQPRHHSVQIVGIWGMGGSGKTTLAKHIYNSKHASMERSSFLFDVRDAASKNMLQQKQKKLLEDLGMKDVSFDSCEEGKGILAKHLRSIRVLVILDDVDHMDQLDALLPVKDNLGFGSLIIVTTRELDVLRCWSIPSIYKMRTLDVFQAKQLFCWHAFLQPSPLDGFEELVNKFLCACNGLPLSLKVFGGHLYEKYCKGYWRCQLDKIYRVLQKDIKETLKISYDVLDDEDKEVFLDVACFFIGKEISLAIEVWNGSGWTGLHSWENLLNKCLVELDEDNCIKMHDHLRDLGREIASKHSPRRLWRPEQVTDFQNEAEKGSIRGIMITTNGSTREVYGGLCGLAASSLGLKIFDVSGDYVSRIIDKLVSRDLVWLRCSDFTGCRTLPSQLSLKKLRVLELFEGRWKTNALNELWEVDSDVSILISSSFKTVFRIIYNCCMVFVILIENVMIQAPAPVQLRELVIHQCDKMKRFPNSIGSLGKLRKIVIKGAGRMESLPEEFSSLLSLEHMQLSGCNKLSSLPSCFGNLTNLRHLDLFGCSSLRRLPVSFKQLTLLQHLDFGCCFKLTFNSDIFENMTKLEYLNLDGCSKLEELPSHITNQVSLRELYLKMLRELPIDIGQLSKLRVMHIESELLRCLPGSIGNLSSLITLEIRCPMLKSVPKSIRQLINLQTLKIGKGCPIEELDFGQGSLCNLKEMQLFKTRVSKISISEHCCPSFETLDICYDDNLTEIEALPRTVKYIRLVKCEMVNIIRGIGGLENLEKLILERCPELQELPSLKELASLRKFKVEGCYKVVKIDGLEHCRSLEQLRAETRWEVPGIQSLEHMERLRTVQLRTNNISAVEPCIRTLKKCPGEIIVCTRSGPDAASQLVNTFASLNLSIVHSIENKEIGSPRFLIWTENAIMICFVTSCELLISHWDDIIKIRRNNCLLRSLQK